MIRRFGNSRLKSITSQDISHLSNDEYLEVMLVSATRNFPYMFGYNDNETVGGNILGNSIDTEIYTNIEEKAYLNSKVLNNQEYVFKLYKRDGQLFLIKDGKEYVGQNIDDNLTHPIMEKVLLEYSDKTGTKYYIGYDTSYDTNPKNGTLGTADLPTAINDNRFHFRLEYVPANGTNKMFKIYNIGTGYYLTRRNNKEYLWSQTESTMNPYMSYGVHNNQIYFGFHCEDKNNPKILKIQYVNDKGVEKYKFGEGDVNKGECMWQLVTLEVQPNSTDLKLPYDGQTTPYPTDGVYFGEPVNNIWMEEVVPDSQGNLLYGYELSKLYRIYQNSNIGIEKCLIHNDSVDSIRGGGLKMMEVICGIC